MLEVLNYIFAIGSIAVFLWSIDVLVLKTRAGARFPGYRDFIEKNTILFGVIVSWSTVIGSLYYSDVVGYEPCVLCWWIRIFLYSSALILLVGLYHKDRGVFRYIKPLSIAGGLFAVYMLIMAWFPGSGLTCSTAELCLREYVKVFGFVTIPFMSLSGTLFLFALSAFATSKNK